MKCRLQALDLIVTSILAIIGIILFINIESYEEEILVDKGNEVNNQQFLALQNHLANYDTELVVSGDYTALFSSTSFNPIIPNVNDIIVFTQSEMVISQPLADELLTWVDNGGHIIVSLFTENYTSTFSTNYLLKELGVQTKEFDQNLKINDGDENEDSSNRPTLVNTEDYGEIVINVEDRIFIALNKSEKVLFSRGILPDQQAQQPTIVQLAVGQGLVTLMSDVYIWNNYQISDYDNLIFIHQLLDYGNRVFVFEQREPIMWPQLLAKYSPSFYWILLFVMLLWAWFVGVRFGAIKEANDSVVSYFSQHIRAAGQFYWMHDQREKLLAAARNQLLDDITTRFSTKNPTDEQIVEELSTLSNWPKEKVYQLVFTKIKVNETQFTQIIQGLQQLRKMI